MNEGHICHEPRGWFCRRSQVRQHSGPCALTPRWWNLWGRLRAGEWL